MTKILRFAILITLLCLGLMIPVANSQAAEPSSSEGVATETLVDAYGNIPLHFEPNRGQVASSEVGFISRGSRYSLFATPEGLTLALRASEEGVAQALRVSLEGANPQLRMSGLEQLPGISNYLIGNDPAQWQTDVPNYGKVRYEQVWDGIDLVLYGNQRQLEYDFVVAPGADAGRIALGFTGATTLHIDENGDLIIDLADGEVQQKAPIIYQELNGKRHEIEGRFSLVGQQVGFEIGEYNSSLPLIIDPVLVYSTYLGGLTNDASLEITVDSSDNAIVVGLTNGADYPASAGSYDTTQNGNQDVFVTKLNSTGTGLVYSTFLGGLAYDRGSDVAVDGTGAVYITGDTRSSDFPTTAGVYDTSFNGGSYDVFVTKLNSTGTGLIYGTFLGGTGLDSGPTGIAIDGGNVYVTGSTSSSDFPTTAGAYDTSINGFQDVFVTKLNSAGAGLIYSTFLGGSSNDYGNGIAVDGSGYAYIIGPTSSSNFPITAGAYDTTYAANTDIFVTKLNTAGTGLVYSTFLGGSNVEAVANNISVDASGNAYVSGQTSSSDYPVTGGAYDTSHNGGDDIFVTKLNTAGTALVYSTFLGTSGIDSSDGLDIDGSGNVYVVGHVVDATFPVTAGAYDTSYNGSNDVVVVKLNPSGNGLIYSSFLGGVSDDYGYGIFAKNGYGYITGATYGTTFPTTAGAYDVSYAGANDVFVAKLNINNTPTISDIPDQISNEDMVVGPLSFSVSDIETAAASLTLSASSSNTALVPISNIVFGGSGTNRTVTATPATNQYGSTTITVTVSDGVVTNADTFLLTVNAVNDAPVISDIPDQITAYGTAKGPVAFTVSDPETAANSLTLSAASSNLAIVPLSNIVFGGSGTNRTVTVTPAAGQYGTVTITTTVSDGAATAFDPFTFTINSPSSDTDGDGIPDGWEVDNGLDPMVDDAAGDPDGEGLTNLEEYEAGTDPHDTDSDNDGIPDDWEVDNGLNPTVDDAAGDADSDGLTNFEEYQAGTDPQSSDTDSDGMPDGWEIDNGLDPLVNDAPGDADSDGAIDLEEYQAGTDPQNSDTDGDGMPDGWELDNGLDPLVDDAAGDPDGDGAANLAEYQASTDPQNVDSDGDGLPDPWESDNGLDPQVDDAAGDADGDGLTNLEEYQAGTDPQSDDSDGDGMPDGWELDNGLDPLVNDTTGDADSDGATNLEEYQANTDPQNEDSDGDGMADGWELDNGLDPGMNDQVEDADNDGLSNLEEYQAGTDPQKADTDGDNVDDALEVGSDPSTPLDTDNDGTPDYADLDDDADSLPTAIECPTGPSCPDTDNDGTADYLDPDSDGDGLPDSVEGQADPDDDDQPTYLDLDSDGDGLLDSLEGQADPDNDGQPNYLDLDSDGDSIADSLEGQADLDGDGQPNYLDLDSDGDGLLDQAEGTDDLDGEGIPNFLDGDSDGDGIPDSQEGAGDPDGDGLPSYLDPDSDNNGILDRDEGADDPDGDGQPNYLDTDNDGDGLLDSQEGAADPDGDGKPNFLDTDSDGDGLLDSQEGTADPDGDSVPNYLDLDSDGDGIADSAEGLDDPDNDGQPNYLDPDSDNDGIKDRVECSSGAPCPDSDGDGTPDYLEALTDSDEDGIPDFIEDADGDGNPANDDADHDGLPNHQDLDSDGDGLKDKVECPVGLMCPDTDGDGASDFLDTDSDNDGKSDAAENGDNDGDGIPNYLDPDDNDGGSSDSDGDGLTDGAECPSGPPCADSDGDGIPDYLDPNNDVVPGLYISVIENGSEIVSQGTLPVLGLTAIQVSSATHSVKSGQMLTYTIQLTNNRTVQTSVAMTATFKTGFGPVSHRSFSVDLEPLGSSGSGYTTVYGKQVTVVGPATAQVSFQIKTGYGLDWTINRAVSVEQAAQPEPERIYLPIVVK